MYHADFGLAGGMFSPTVLGLSTQLIAVPTEYKGQEICQLYRTREKKEENTSFRDRNNLIFCPLRPILYKVN